MVGSEDRETVSCFKTKFDKIKIDFAHIADIGIQLAQDDPRRVVHSLKVGLAITLVSMFYYFEPLYDGFGVNAMWAVLTVVVVFEYSVGATLGKGVNRSIATTIGGMLGVGAHMLTHLPENPKIEPFLIGLVVFIFAAVTTFGRFFPKMKARYDYGFMVFILTFSLISVSGYRYDEVLDMAHRRISTILIGSSTAVIICVVICPVWAGRDLHDLVADNLDKLANFLEEFGEEYFENKEMEISKEKKECMEAYKSILNSKTTMDALVNFARWEPRHGRFKYWHPWEQYQKVGGLMRRCACRIEALNDYLHSRAQVSREVKSTVQDPCTKISLECSKALKQLSLSMKKMTHPTSHKSHLENSKQATQLLHLYKEISFSKDLDFKELMTVATVASLLIDIESFVEKLEEAVQELASLAKFKKRVSKVVSSKPALANQGSVKRRSFTNHVIVIDEGPISRCSRSFKDPPSSATVQESAE